MITTTTRVKAILTRSGGFLKTVCSHSLQPYRGCPFGRSLCGVACYVRHNVHVTKGRPWGSFLEVRQNAAESYLASFDREQRWARRGRDRFVIFLSSSTEPFPPQEERLGMTRSVLEAMIECPPDGLIVQTHSHHVTKALDVLGRLNKDCDLRLHVSIETDRDRLPGLPAHASSLESRFEAARMARKAGLRVVVTVAPLLPIERPDDFFARIAEVADAVVLDHYIGGDGSPGGTRTERTALPEAMAAIEPASVRLEYRDQLAEIARRHLPGRVGLNIDGFAGRAWT